MKALRAIVGIGFIVAVAYTVFLLLPPYYNNYQFQDEVTSETRLSTYSQKSEDEIRENIWRKAKEFDIPVTRDQINVRRDGQTVAIWVDYKVRVDLPGYPLDLQFHASSQNKRGF
jgi:CRISPR/Cas system-associated protein Cas5 (RAMP superfamily)